MEQWNEANGTWARRDGTEHLYEILEALTAIEATSLQLHIHAPKQ